MLLSVEMGSQPSLCAKSARPGPQHVLNINNP